MQRLLPLPLALLLLAAGAPADEAEPEPRPEPSHRAAAASNRFAFDLYARLAAREGNLLCSPYSISSALAMTHAGARGETARQMAQVLHFPAPELLHAGMTALRDGLEAAAADPGVELDVANALWARGGKPLLPGFVELVRAHYGGPLFTVDYAGAPEAACREINAWVGKHTHERITDLIHEDLITPDTSLILTNALYFRGSWQHPFRERATADAPFHIAAGKQVDVPTMRQVSGFRYAEVDGAQVLELPYRGRRLSMVVLLPGADEGIAALEARLAADRVERWIDGMRGDAVEVALPKFRFTSQFGLGETLQAMGMREPFLGTADFSGIDGKQDLYISAVVHKAFVAVDEAGTEAAAATAVAMERKGRPSEPRIFRADRPFLFLIRDRTTGCILFLGRVADPRG